MLELQGKHNKAVVYTDNIEQEAIAQIIELCNQEFVKDSTIRIMPDTHAGAGCTIGTTMTITNKIVPNLVGVDIGCGMFLCRINEKDIDLETLDKVIHERIPSGFDVRKCEHRYIDLVNLEGLKCKSHVNLERARLSLSSLGGGNHFVEANKDGAGNIYIVVHTGSRYLGKQVAEFYQETAYTELMGLKDKKAELIKELKAQGRVKDIQTELKKVQPAKIKKDLAYLEGENFNNYIHDMRIVQGYAVYNRKAIMDEILRGMGLTAAEQFTTIHNYIDTETMILRKGAISAQAGERVLIPINMRDGSIIAIGKGNPDWNFSAPHGAGRLFSRSTSKERITLEEFQESMQGIYSTSVCASTIDESPMAYKPMEEIVANIQGTVDIHEIIKPIYNFKSC